MSAVEAAKWQAYRSKRGPLNLSAHIETGFASLIAKSSARPGVLVSTADFLYYWDPSRFASVDEEEGEATLADVMGILAGAVRNGK